MRQYKLNRRGFLKRSVAAGIPFIVPAFVLGRGANVAPSNRITLGSIGVGGMGTGNLKGFLDKDDAHVLAVCDVDKQHRNRARDMVNRVYNNTDCSTYNDFRELLERKDIDAVVLALPDHWHAIAGVYAARSGKDIYAEKPLAYTISEGRAIVDAVERYRTVWQTGSQQRSSQKFRFACELVRNGRIGNVHTVKVGLPYGLSERSDMDKSHSPIPEGFDYDMWLGPAPWAPFAPARCHWSFRWIRDYSGGQITDWAGHHCDIAQWGMNTELTAPIEIEGKAEYPPPSEVLFNTAISYRFECKYKQGFKLIVADDRKFERGTLFEGDEGWVFVSRRRIDAQPRSLLRSVIKPNEIHLYKSNDHRQNFLDCVKTRRETVAPARVAHRSIMIGHLGLIAMQTGRKVVWNPDNEQFINDPVANAMLVRPMRSPWNLIKLSG
jgi:predicted dehydrogenase